MSVAGYVLLFSGVSLGAGPAKADNLSIGKFILGERAGRGWWVVVCVWDFLGVRKLGVW